ncbi:MAG: RagB/SusD family nutrient uptake outer membrane protein [Cytophagales bacterium]|nr:RagB/SusD family nutrient uptake outer membrane protein [Cytophagales bacterium]
MELAASGAYNKTFLSDWDNPVGNNLLAFECIGDHVYLLPQTSANIPYNELYQRRFGINLSDNSSFSLSYDAIGVCNNGISFFEENNNLPFPQATSTELASLERIKGELHLIRAFNYWHLALRYLPKPGASNYSTAGLIPQRLTVPKTADEAINIKYLTGKETYELVLADLKEAKDLLPEQYRPAIDDDSYQHGRANRYTAAALLARVYFLLGSQNATYYDSALTQLDYVISGPFDLNQDPIEAWNRSDASQGSEVIWYVLFYDLGQGNTFKRPTSLNYSDYRARDGNRGTDQLRCPWNQFTLSFDALQRIGWFDSLRQSTPEALMDKRYQQLYYRLEGNRDQNDNPLVYEMQYPHIKEAHLWGDKYYRAPDGQYSNVPIIRLAEMLLTRSILRLRHKSDPSGAVADLNLVRQRAGLPPLAPAELTEEHLHAERLKELAFEMDWVIYQMSLGLTIGTGDRTEGEGSTISPPYEGLYWSLPQTELDFKNN